MLEKFLAINSLIVAITGGGMLAIAGGALKFVLNDRRSFHKRLINLEDSNIAILHDKIYKYCTEYIYKGFASVDDLDNLEYLFKSYKLLGGNGTGDTLYNKVKQLPIKKEGI